nr:TnsA-like heteromeric transposase endonuclease subunit [Streptomyces roseifaciens]
MARLLFADFDPSVRHIVAQPFLVKALVEGAVRRHVPDYLLLTEAGPLVVDVKPLRRLDQPEVAFTLGWSRHLAEDRGWRYEVWSEPPVALLENVRFLAGYRRNWLFPRELLDALDPVDLDGLTLGEALRRPAGVAREYARAGIFHLLWAGRLTTDLRQPLSASHVLRSVA